MKIFLIFFMVIQSFFSSGQELSEPLKIAVIGLTHTHVHWILGRPEIGDIEIVGIVEPNLELAKRYAAQHGFSMDLVYKSSEALLADVRPEAVAAFGPIYDHLKVVQTFAPLGMHIMVEKPLAVNMEHARKMEALVRKHHVHLFTNYETSWYPSNAMAYELIQKDSIGELKKIVVHDGHRGPQEIGVNEEFLEWLRNPELNGGGAVTDFGCYGANLITWLAGGKRPLSVTAILQSLKPEVYPDVDDEATIILTYPDMQGIIQASWNWPVARKDMEVYGDRGQLFCDNAKELRVQYSEKASMQKMTLPDLPPPDNDPFAKFAALIRNNSSLGSYDLSGLENNMLVVEILDAAKNSARQAKTIFLDQK